MVQNSTIHFPVEYRRKDQKEIKMAIKLTAVKNVKSERGVGRKATEPKVRVTENGQLAFNSLAMVPFVGSIYAYALTGSDKTGNIVQIMAVPKITADTKFPVLMGRKSGINRTLSSSTGTQLIRTWGVL